jgi:hypothetical protein
MVLARTSVMSARRRRALAEVKGIGASVDV